jgi:hypothetical protein
LHDLRRTSARSACMRAQRTGRRGLEDQISKMGGT